MPSFCFLFLSVLVLSDINELDLLLIRRTPDVSTMHQDESADLRDVARILKNVLGVSLEMSYTRIYGHDFACLTGISVHMPSLRS